MPTLTLATHLGAGAPSTVTQGEPLAAGEKTEGGMRRTMGSRIRLRTARSLILAGVLGLTALVAPGSAFAAPLAPNAAPDNSATAQRLSSQPPRAPRLPKNFRGKGRYIVRDLGLNVPFTWRGHDGNSKMVAGGPNQPIWFTNLIYENSLYTVTYKWPGLRKFTPCAPIPNLFFNRKVLNTIFATARFVGPEILQGKPRRRVNHFRAGIVIPTAPPGDYLRFPFALGDVYVDQRNPSTFWQVLQFGLQNLFDPALDEWFKMKTFVHRPGRVKLPQGCAPPIERPPGQ